MIRFIDKYSLIGVPIGLLALLFDNVILRSIFFIVGGAICATGFYAGVVIRAEKKAAKDKSA